MKKHQFAASQLALIIKQSQITKETHDLDKRQSTFSRQNSQRSSGSCADFESRKVTTKSPKYQLSRQPHKFLMYDGRTAAQCVQLEGLRKLIVSWAERREKWFIALSKKHLIPV